ncbi:MAG: YraN family protein [Anaerolineae bacterium]
MHSKQVTGEKGEDLACVLLQEKGYQLIERHWRSTSGEIDIVARDGDCWVFVEVKTRHGSHAGLPEEALTKTKWERISELAQTFMGEHDLMDVDWRIDLVALELYPDNRIKRVNVVQGTISP